MVKPIRGGVTAPVGFKASGVYCGIKSKKAKDIALIYSETPCVATGVFTTNKVRASCVWINEKILRRGKAQAIIANSGNANCMTGKSGFENSKKMALKAAKCLGLKGNSVCVASTGIIGKPLPISKIAKAIPILVKRLSRAGSKDAALGIMTTDRKMKEAAAELNIGGRNVRIGAIAKGAGMIHPEMSPAPHATMLCFVTTDAAIEFTALRAALNIATQKSFNMITIDGDMSTNDMVLVLANGMARNKKIVQGTKESKIFADALTIILLSLAKLMVQDAEGATKFVEISVVGAQSEKDAREVARSVASSNLFKCALYGSDPNWGRIASSAGQSGARLDPAKMKISLGGELVLQNGGPVRKKEAVLRRVFRQKNIRIKINLVLGKASATAYTCDLSAKYVQLNSAYHT